MTNQDDLLGRAFGYPYPAPRHSYLFDDGRVEAFDPALTAGRIPVLAIGSNRAPDQLARKFQDMKGTRIPVERVFLSDFDVVHAATLTRYGAVPAMLQHMPGTRVEVMLTWLNEQQLARMHATELGAANYSFARLEHIRLERDDNSVSDRAFCYVGARGAFSSKEHAAFALAAVPAEGRSLPQADTRAMLDLFSRLLGWRGNLDSFVETALGQEDRRRAWVDALAPHARPFAYPWQLVTTG